MKLSIFFTNHCNINCEHCFLGEQRQKYKMSDEMLTRILIQAKELGIKTICFTGGEPLIYCDNICNAIKMFELKDIKFTVSTNAFWSDTIKNADRMCLKLHDSYIKQLEVSCDAYHIKYIPIQNIINLIEAAEKYCMTVKIIMSVSNDVSYLSIYSKLLKYTLPSNIIIQQVALFGNALKNSIDSNINIERFKKIKCDQILNPCITYSGDIYACCGPCIVLGKTSSLYLSNIDCESLAFAIKKMMSNRVIQKIYNNGPYSIAHAKTPKICSSLCEICLKTHWEMA